MRHWSKIRAVGLAGIGGLAAGVLLCWLLGLDPKCSGIYLWTAMMGALTGVEVNGRTGKGGWLLLTAGAILAMMPQLLFLTGYLTKMAGAAVFLLSFGALVVSAWGFYGPLGVWATVLSGIAVFPGRAMGMLWSGIVTLCALMALGLTMDGFRDSSVRKAFHKKREHRASGAPKELTRFHIVLCLVFLAGAVLVTLVTYGFVAGLLKTVKTGILQGFDGILGILSWLFWAIEWLIQWFSDLFPDHIEDKNPSISVSIEETVYTGGSGSLVSTVIMVILFVLLCLAAGALAARGVLQARKKPKKAEASVDYVDEVERLRRPAFFKKKKARADKYGNLTEPEQKLRYIFRKLLLKKMREDGASITHTPNELLDPAVPDEPELVEAYNLLRYGKRAVTPEQLAAAERYLNNM